MIFANIEYLFLLILLIPYIIWYVMKRKKTEPTLQVSTCLLYTSPRPRDGLLSRMPSSA